MIWGLIRLGRWGALGVSENHIQRSVVAMRIELKAFYKRRSRQHPNEQLTRCNTITRNMIGTASERKLGTKGAETWGVLLFLIDVFSSSLQRLGEEARAWLEAARCLEAMCTVMNNSGVNFSVPVHSEIFSHWIRFLHLTSAWTDLHIPKRHAVSHMVFSALFYGNPRFYATWTDESLNKLLQAACRQLSQATFEDTVLLSMAHLLKEESQKRKCS